MTMDRLILAIAGTFIIISVALSHFHSPYWLYFTAFVGLNLLQASFTRWCPMVTFLRMAGIKKGVAFD
jgi:hypothetical protein